jgi:hypothetical protein
MGSEYSPAIIMQEATANEYFLFFFFACKHHVGGYGK